MRYLATRWQEYKGMAITTTIIRACQFILGVAVVGLYAMDVVKKGNLNPKWLFAIGIGGFSALVTAIFIGLRACSHWHYSKKPGRQLLWRVIGEVFMVVLWAAVAGIFGMMYIGHQGEKETKTDTSRMRIATYFDFLNLAFWVISFAFTASIWWPRRHLTKEDLVMDDYPSMQGPELKATENQFWNQ